MSRVASALLRLAGPGTLLLALASGLLCAQVAQLTADPGGDSAGAPFQPLLLLKAVCGAWVLLALVQTALALRLPPVAHSPGAGVPGLAGPVALVLGGALLMALLTLPSTGRLSATLVCYLILSLVIGWTVWRRAGAAVATRGLLAFSLFAAVAAGTDLRQRPRIQEARADSAYRWVAGWPTAAWTLRHELRPLSPLPPRPMTLKVPLAGPYEGPARVYATLNGADLGAATLVNGKELHVDVPAALVAGAPHLVFELRQRPGDPRMRLTAHRWGRGATAGPGASSYSDGQRWWPGTFNDALGRPQPGIYVLQLDPQ